MKINMHLIWMTNGADLTEVLAVLVKIEKDNSICILHDEYVVES